MSRVVAVAMLSCLLGAPAVAQDDDLVPLSPARPKARPPARKVAPARRAPPRPVTMDLTVKVARDVSGATLSVDGKELGLLPMAPVPLTQGEHTVVVKRPGYQTLTRKITVGGRPVEVDASKMVAVAGVVTILTNAPGADVYAGGRFLASAPVTALEMPPGTVELRASAPGYQDRTELLAVQPGREYTVRFELERAPPPPDRPEAPRALATPVVDSTAPVSGLQASPPVTQRWYFWVGLVVGVAAVAAGTVLAVSATQPPRRPVEGELCPGGCDDCIGLVCSGPGTGFSF